MDKIEFYKMIHF